MRALLLALALLGACDRSFVLKLEGIPDGTRSLHTWIRSSWAPEKHDSFAYRTDRLRVHLRDLGGPIQLAVAAFGPGRGRAGDASSCVPPANAEVCLLATGLMKSEDEPLRLTPLPEGAQVCSGARAPLLYEVEHAFPSSTSARLRGWGFGEDLSVEQDGEPLEITARRSPLEVEVTLRRVPGQPLLTLRSADGTDEVRRLLRLRAAAVDLARGSHFLAEGGNAARRDPQAMAAGDIDGKDGPDLAVAETTPGKIALLFNRGARSDLFNSPFGDGELRRLDAPGAPVALALADLDPDPAGRLDLVAALRDRHALRFWRNQGQTLSLWQECPLSGQPTALAVVSPHPSETVVVVAIDGAAPRLLSLRPVGCQPLWEVPLPGPALALAVGDLDRDGEPDLALARRGSDGQVVLELRLNGAPDPALSVPVEHREIGALAIGDFDGDCWPDLALSDLTRSVEVRWGGERSTFQGSSGSDRLNFPDDLIAVDLDGDGQDELAVVNGSRDLLSVVRAADRARALLPPGAALRVGEGGQLPALVAADFNQDGRQDLAVSNKRSLSTDAVRVLINVSY